MRLDWARLARTPLYRAAWGDQRPDSLEDAPPMTVWQWRQHIHAHAERSLLSNPALWVLYPVPGDDAVWVPLGPADIEAGAAFARRMFASAGIVPGDAVLAVAPPAPWAGNTLPYLFSSTDRLLPKGSRLAAEVFPLSVTTVGYKADLSAFPLSRLPSVVAGSPDEIDALLQLAQTAGLQAPRFRLALLVGTHPAETNRADLADSIVHLLYIPGLFAPVGGHPDDTGVWLPAELLTAELIADDEWGRSVQDPARVPLVRPLAVAAGETGELVITVLNTALPVVRLRTALRIRVDEIAPDGTRVEVISRPAARPAAERVSAFTPAARPVRTRQNHRATGEA